MKKETLEEVINRIYGNDEDGMYINKIDFKDGVKWQQEKSCIDIEQKWNEYRCVTNNKDAWSFKEWLVREFKKK